MAGRVGFGWAVVLVALGAAGCTRRPLAKDGGVLVVPDAGAPVARDSGGETPPDAAPDVSRDVAAETPPDAAPDVSRDVAAETPPDVAPDLARDGLVGGDADRPADGGTVPAGRALSLLSNWPRTPTAGLTVDATSRVFRADRTAIHVFEGGQFRTYMSIAEAVSGLGMSESGWFIDIDMGSDGLLYILLAPSFPTATGLVVARSSSAHTATRLLDFPPTTAAVMRVIAPGKVAIPDFFSGIWTASAAGQQVVYPPALPGFTCVSESVPAGHLAVGPAGLFLVSSGCPGSALMRGNLDGSGIIRLYEPRPSPVSADNFICLARDPAGGFYMMVTDDGTGATPRAGTRLYHVADDASGTSGFTRVATTPSFDQARLAQADQNVFTSCALAAAPDGTVYVQTLYMLWKIAP